MAHCIARLGCMPSQLDGLSPKLIVSHYQNNYGGAVRRLNAIEAEWAKLDVAVAPNYVLNGLKREELIARNSMALHEIYFASLGGKGDPGGDLAAQLEKDFGSVARWRAEFVAMGKALGGGSGWVLLTWGRRDGKLSNQWASDHGHTAADGVPILALDMYEHSYHMDFGADAGRYVDTFMKNVDWDGAAKRLAAVRSGASPFEAPEGVAVEDLRERLTRKDTVVVLDVRRAADFESDPQLLPGATWRDPEKIDAWVADLPKGVPVVVYCKFGHYVSRNAAEALRAKGVDAQIVNAGIAGWRAIGAPVEAGAGGTKP